MVSSLSMVQKRKPHILVVDDEEDIRSSLKMILEYEGLEMTGAASAKEALYLVQARAFDAVLLDIKMPRMDGLELLGKLRELQPALPVVMISGHGTVATAVEATRLGAYDFMEKPLERDRVLLVLRNALEQHRLREENYDLRLSFESKYRLIGSSRVMDEVRESIARVAPTSATVLITGESGTGKELVARGILRNSTRADHPFIKVNCAAIPEELIESELFGHSKGSFTGAVRDQVGKFVQADGGTIFLDEVGDMSLKTQAKVLRVLQDGEVEPVGAATSLTVDVRVLAATNKDLASEIEAGTFREDLYFRLNVLLIELPALRERSDDIKELIDYFTEQYCGDDQKKVFDSEVIEAMQGLPWRGNIRELRNAVERLLIMTSGPRIGIGDIPAGLGLALGRGEAAVPEGSLLVAHAGKSLQAFKDGAERSYLLNKLRSQNWNIAATAKLIETPRSNLYKKLETYGISREQDDE
jgi:two-component system nitrogen regulation response regulator NtrX